MVDFGTAQSSASAATAAGKVSSQEYLEQLRQRRLQRYQNGSIQVPVAQTAQPETPQPTTAIDVPVHTPPVIKPTHAQTQSPSEAWRTADEVAPSEAWRRADELPPSEPATAETPPPTPEPDQPPSLPDQDSNDQERYEDYDEYDSYNQQNAYFPGQMRPMKEEVVLEWEAPSRPFKKRNRQFFTTAAFIALLISLILFFIGQVLIIAVVISVVFLVYVLATVPPENIKNSITTYGIRSDDVLYYWEELGRFWFDVKLGQQLVSIETARFPSRIILLLGDQPEEVLREILSEVLLEERPVPTALEKMANWIEEKIPLETD